MASILMLDCDLEQRVIRFVAETRARKPDDITTNSRLLHDLGIDGDDASELLTDYAEVFDVDLSGFHFASHFWGEGFSIGSLLLAFLRNQRPDPKIHSLWAIL